MNGDPYDKNIETMHAWVTVICAENPCDDDNNH